MPMVGVPPGQGGASRLEVVMTPQQRGATMAAPPASVQHPVVERRNLAARERLMARLEGEFAEMPGLHLTPPQASRLLALEPAACSRLLRALVDRGVLRTTASGHYVGRSSPR